jgi:hypothetical protein
MQSAEAILSMLILFSIVTTITQYVRPAALDDSLYHYQLTGDVWRVLYFRGDFQNLTLSSPNTARDKLEKDLETIHGLTGLCGYFGGVRATSCAGQAITNEIGRINHIVFINGQPKSTTLSIARAR